MSLAGFTGIWALGASLLALYAGAGLAAVVSATATALRVVSGSAGAECTGERIQCVLRRVEISALGRFRPGVESLAMLVAAG